MKVKLTVLCSKCRSGIMSSGKTYIIDEICPPVCAELWHQIYPYYFALANGAFLDYDGTKKSRESDVICPDEGRVKVHLQAIEE